jgi:hypothetical protein
MRRVLLLLLLPGVGVAAETLDEHPRRPGQPLVVEFKPYFCPLCLKERRIDGPAKEVTLMRLPAAQIAAHCGLGKKWLVIESPHFKLFSNLRAARVRRRDSAFVTDDMKRLQTIFPTLTLAGQASGLTPHQRAHLYHIRLERIYAHFRALTANDRPWLGMLAPYEVYLFERYRELHKFTDRFFGRSNDESGIRHHVTEEPNFLAFATATSQVDGMDRQFSNNVIHNAAHLMSDGYGNLYRETWAWLEEGISHYYERRENPAHNTFCWTEGRRPTAFAKPNWERTILGLVLRKRDVPLGQWCEKLTPGELTDVEQGLSWSIVEWMIETDPVRFSALIEKLQDFKNKPTSAQCIEFAFGVTPSELHARWREYVREDYPKRKG